MGHASGFCTLKASPGGDDTGREEVSMVVIVSGQPAPMPGFYVDPHGHRLLLRPAEPAPLCRLSGASPVPWRLERPLPLPGPRS